MLAASLQRPTVITVAVVLQQNERPALQETLHLFYVDLHSISELSRTIGCIRPGKMYEMPCCSVRFARSSILVARECCLPRSYIYFPCRKCRVITCPIKPRLRKASQLLQAAPLAGLALIFQRQHAQRLQLVSDHLSTTLNLNSINCIKI